MSSESCWECGEGYSRDEVFDIPVFKQGWTAKWCFNCAMKQLVWSDYRLIPEPKKYFKFRIQSQQDRGNLYSFYLDELIKCYESQFGELCSEDFQLMADLSWDQCSSSRIKYSHFTRKVKV